VILVVKLKEKRKNRKKRHPSSKISSASPREFSPVVCQEYIKNSNVFKLGCIPSVKGEKESPPIW
jgi:hypothetical protein